MCGKQTGYLVIKRFPMNLNNDLQTPPFLNPRNTRYQQHIQLATILLIASIAAAVKQPIVSRKNLSHRHHGRNGRAKNTKNKQLATTSRFESASTIPSKASPKQQLNNADDIYLSTTYWAECLNQHVPHIQPTFKTQHFEQCQHRIADIVKVETSRVRPFVCVCLCVWECQNHISGFIMFNIGLEIFKGHSPNSRHQHRWIRLVLARFQFHLRYEDSTHENANAVFTFQYRWIVASCETTSVKLHSVTREYEHQ